MLITSSIPNMVNGISQQPSTLRLASQAENQDNFLASVAEGLVRRPPTRHITKLDAEGWGDAFIHTINRDAVERYTAVIRGGVVRVFEAETGVERPVAAPDGWGYLSGANGDFRAVTVADYTFILNRRRVPEMSSTLSPDRPNQALLVVRAGNYGKNFRVFVNGTLSASYTTPRGDEPEHVDEIRTGVIAAKLREGLDASPLGAAGFNITSAGDLISISRSDQTSFVVRVEDDAGGTLMAVLQASTQRFSDLPVRAFKDFVTEIAGDQSSSFDNYHVRFDTPNAGLGAGVWKETLKGGEAFRLNRNTMPHVLVRMADGTFEFRRADWEDREVGDLKKMPQPSFIGRPIRDIFFYRNRLGLIADENVILSQSGEFFNFWRGTATSVLDTDPIDIAVTTARVSLLNHAIPFSQSLLLFSDQTQFMLDGGDVLTPSTVAVNQLTTFESIPNVRPVGVGAFVYFPVPRGTYAGLRELFVQEGRGGNADALDVTSHVPRFLPRDIRQMAVSTSEDILVVTSRGDRNFIWVYKYFANDEGKLQSAWSRWTLSPGDGILHVEFIENTLFIITRRPDGTHLERLDVESGAVDTDSEYQYRADRGVYSENLPTTYDAGTNTTTWQLPYTSSFPMWVITRAGDAVYPEGKVLEHERPSTTQVRVPGDFRGRKVFIGVRYTSIYEFSTLHIRGQEAGGGISSKAEGRLQVRYMSLDYSRTGYFEFVSQPKGRSASKKIFSGRVLASQGGTIGVTPLQTGRFRAPVQCRNTEAKLVIQSDSFLPCAFTAAEWEATFTTRAKKV